MSEVSKMLVTLPSSTLMKFTTSTLQHLASDL